MKTDWFTKARFGLFIHWGISSIPAHDVWAMFKDDWDYAEYEKFAGRFNPVDFNPEAWAELAWNAGMRYMVFTTKHHDGFCMFDSKYTDYKITNTPYGKDITAELCAAFRKRGLKIGFYHSLVDWRHPHFIPDAEHPLWKRGQRDFAGRNREIYQEYLYKQVEQLMTGYGKIDLLFLDYTSKHKTSDEWAPERLLEMIYRLQPEIIVNDRLSYDKKSFTGDYCTPEISVPNQPVEISGIEFPWETCMTMNSSWGFNSSDTEFKTPATIITALANCVSKNGNLLMNVGPDARGNIPPQSIAVLQAAGEWFKLNGEAIHGCGKTAYLPPTGYFYTAGNNCLYLHMPFAPMGDIILPQLNGKVEKVELLATGEDVPMITYWGSELLLHDELRIRPPVTCSKTVPSVLKISMAN